jgi:iron complex outermembrane receptor protein
LRLPGYCRPRTRTWAERWPLAALAALLPDAASAQPTAPPPAQTFERVLVTGSHITQTELEGALPVQIITREEIERSGVTSVEQLLDRVPANVNAVNAAQTIGSSDQPGLAAANLRGLGAGSTLMLLNGRRLANYAFNGEAVDLNAIPLAAIERVDVLRDGASAIYGTDAIAGVINFILRKDYRGLTAAGSFDATQHGGGNSGQASLTLGAGDPDRDGYNVFGVLSYQKQQALHGSERESTRTSFRPDLGVSGLSGFTFPSNIIDRPGRRILNPALAGGCLPPSSLPNTTVFPFPSTACGFDPAAVADVLPEVERTSALLRGTWRLSPTTDVFAEALWARSSFHTEVAPYPQPAVATPFGSPVYPAGGPYYPTEFAATNGLSGDLLFSWRATELGRRINTTSTDAQRYVLGLEGQAAGWDYNAAAVYSANEQEVEYRGSYVYQSRIIPALRSGLVNPWGPTGPEGQALLAASIYNGTPQTADGSTSQLGAVASKEVAALPAGPLALALGGEARRERLSYDWDPAVLTGDSPIGSRLKAISGSRDVLALFVEANVPIAHKLDAQLAARWDDYSDFGSTNNPKAALRWQPLPSLLLRGSWGEGFRAPPLYSLNEPSANSDVAAGFPDPARCPVTGTLDDCLIIVPLTTGGNPNLQPETSTQWSVGTVWEPVARLSIGLDYWSIEQDGVISTLDPAYIVANESQFPGRVIRGPVDPAYPTLPGPIVAIDGSLINIGKTETSGVDVAVRWRSAATDAGTFGVGLQGTYVRQFDTQLDGVRTVSLLGDATQGGSPVPRWRSTLTFDWNHGPWGATLSQLYSSGYAEWRTFPTATRTVGAAATWDLQGRYNGFRNWQLAAGVRNLLDSEPPFSLTSSFQFGFNPQVASPLGRTFYLRASYAMK